MVLILPELKISTHRGRRAGVDTQAGVGISQIPTPSHPIPTPNHHPPIRSFQFRSEDILRRPLRGGVDHSMMERLIPNPKHRSTSAPRARP